jgi:isochorismate synthase
MQSQALIKKYQVEKNNFYFSTPDYELLAENISGHISFNKATDIPKHIGQMKVDKGLKGKLIVGAIPFDVNESAYLYIADQWQKQDKAFDERKKALDVVHLKNPVHSKKYLPAESTYMEMVEKGVASIQSGSLDKIVLSRGLQVSFENKIDPTPILHRLYEGNSHGYTYAMQLNNQGYLLGASPEMLVSKRDRFIYSNPLAGTRPRGKTSQEDKTMADILMASSKDQKEHKFVVDTIVDKISPICKDVEASKSPHLIKTSQLWHLSSLIKGELKDEGQTVFDAALAIHPTPAICGVPQDQAYAKIAELEGRNRELFTGIIGWCDEKGDGDWAILIRGAEIKDETIFIQAGAGIVHDSIPEEEMKETGAKFRTMLHGINLKEDTKKENEDGNQ